MKKLFGLLSVLTLVFAFTLTSCDKDGEPQPTGEPTTDLVVYVADSIYDSNQEYYDSLVLSYIMDIYGNEYVSPTDSSLQVQIDSLNEVIHNFPEHDNVLFYTGLMYHYLSFNEDGTVSQHIETNTTDPNNDTRNIQTYVYFDGGFEIYLTSYENGQIYNDHILYQTVFYN